MFVPYWKLPPERYVAELELQLNDLDRRIAEYSKEYFGVPQMPQEEMFQERGNLIAQIGKIRIENHYYFDTLEKTNGGVSEKENQNG